LAGNNLCHTSSFSVRLYFSLKALGKNVPAALRRRCGNGCGRQRVTQRNARVEPICAQLPIAPSVYYEPKARQANPARLPPRAQRAIELSRDIRRV
jgi:hypothetical protein